MPQHVGRNAPLDAGLFHILWKLRLHRADGDMAATPAGEQKIGDPALFDIPLQQLDGVGLEIDLALLIPLPHHSQGPLIEIQATEIQGDCLSDA